jgi:hypothetical protein
MNPHRSRGPGRHAFSAVVIGGVPSVSRWRSPPAAVAEGPAPPEHLALLPT